MSHVTNRSSTPPTTGGFARTRAARAPLAACVILVTLPAAATAQQPQVFTHADTLHGSNTPQRAWWDATFYDLHARVTPADSSVSGWNTVTYRVLAPAQELQLDLQAPLTLDSVVQRGRRLVVREDGNAWFATLVEPQRAGDVQSLTAYYHGSFAHWDESRDSPFIWATDSLGAPWVATSDEDLGASAWWPLKDLPADEPDSQRIAITVPDPMIDVSSGRLRSTTHHPDGTTTYEWFVTEPINSYDVAVNADRHYVHFSDVFHGEGGDLTLDFWPLSYHLDTARVQFQEVQPMLRCFESWFGPYPWYPDGYKLVETPYLGMEHQSGIAYGNRYLQGYLGRDLSGTGIGLKWDYIIVHESAHEWWGNSISAKDHADMWLHESFAMYAEGLYTECQQGKAAGERYLIGLRARIKNDMPILGHYGVYNVPVSQDRYFKGANMLLTMRQVVNDDAKWRAALRGANRRFYHQTVTGREVEEYLSAATGVDLSKIFEQYLATTMIPVLQYEIADSTLRYRWSDVVPGFAMPLEVTLTADCFGWIHPTAAWQTTPVHLGRQGDFRVDDRFYVGIDDVGAGGPATRTR
jgi:aminopeptidase N